MPKITNTSGKNAFYACTGTESPVPLRSLTLEPGCSLDVEDALWADIECTMRERGETPADYDIQVH